MDWCNEREVARIAWFEELFAVQVCLLTPLTLLLIVLSGNSGYLWAFAMGAITIQVPALLSELPAKATIPLLFISIAIELALVTTCIVHGF
jgi:hypothetical protein